MKYLTKIIVWIVAFLVVLAIRFPYERVFLNMVDRLQQQTNVQIYWDDLHANIFGAKLTNLLVEMPSGFAFEADQATIRPGFNGLSLACTQTAKGGSAKAQITRQGLEFTADKLETDTGSKDIGTVTMSGNLAYGLADSAAKGELRFVVPELSGILPIPLNNLEIGTVITTESSSNKESSTISNALTIYGEGLDGEGNVDFTFVKGSASPSLSGELKVNTKGFGSHTIKLGGTWAQPQWNLAGAEK